MVPSLLKYSLVNKETPRAPSLPASVSINYAVQQAVIMSLTDPSTTFWRAYWIVKEHCPSISITCAPKIDTWHALKLVLPHIISLHDKTKGEQFMKIAGKDGILPPLSSLLVEATIILWHDGNFREAMRIAKSAEEIMQKSDHLVNTERADLEMIISRLERFRGLEMRRESMERLKRACDIWEALGEPSSIRIANLELAEAALQEGKTNEAERGYDEFLRVSTPPVTLEECVLCAKSRLGKSLCHLFKGYIEAACDEAVEVQRALKGCGGDLLATHRLEFGVACVFFQAGWFEQALKLHKGVFELRKQRFGELSVWTILSRYAIASLYIWCKDYAKAKYPLTPPPSIVKSILTNY